MLQYFKDLLETLKKIEKHLELLSRVVHGDGYYKYIATHKNQIH